MSCEAREAELIQGLAAGTLSGEERVAAVQHADSCEECRSDLAVLRDMMADLRTLHLTTAELVEAAWSGSRPEHLQDCDRCRDEVDTLVRVNQELRGRRPRFGLPHALAASLLAATLGLGVWNRELREQGDLASRRLAAAQERLRQSEAERARLLRETPAPQLNVPIVDLEPAIPSRSGVAPRPHQLEFAAGVDSATLILVTRPMRPHPRYLLEVRDASQRIIWRSEGLTRSAYDTLTLSVPRALLPAGSYRFILYGARDGALEHLEEYVLLVRHR
jgi:hypothetical protein